MVNRRQLDAILRELKLSQSGLIDAVLAKSGVKFTAADLILTGNLSQAADTFTMAVEVIDVKTARTVASARSQFPRTGTVQAWWDNTIEAYVPPATTPNASTQTNSNSSTTTATTGSGDTKPGSVLDYGQVWKHQGLEFTLSDLRFNTAGARFIFRISNRSDRERPIRILPEMFKATDNKGKLLKLGRCFDGAYANCGGALSEFTEWKTILKTEESIHLPDGLFAFFVPIDLFNTSINSIVFTFTEAPLLNLKASWRISLPK